MLVVEKAGFERSRRCVSASFHYLPACSKKLLLLLPTYLLMQRSSLLLIACSRYSILSAISKRIPFSRPITRCFIKRSYAANSTTKTTTANAGPPINAARRVLSLPTKVTEMKLRCNYAHFILLMAM